MSVARNTAYNLAGAMVPFALALVTVPLYLHRIGEARYGVLAIVWLLLGYFGSFDMGLSRAAANMIARLGDAGRAEREQVFWTVCLINSGIGVVTGAVFYFAAGSIFASWFKMASPLRIEVITVLPWIAIAVPVATVTAAFTGTLEGLQRFRTVNAIQTVGTVAFQVIPLATAYWFGPSLQFVIPAAVVARVVTTLPLVSAVRSALPVKGSPHLRFRRVRELFSYGSWVAITNIVGPILHIFDRFLIGIVLGASAVAYYTVPFQLVNRVQVVPGALSRALFPHLSALDDERSNRVAVDAVIPLSAIMTPMIVMGLLAIGPFLRLWLGAGFAHRSAAVAEILLVGVWLNGLAYVPYALLQARGRPDLVARFHLLELIPFAILLWFGLHRFGIVGASLAWTVRVGVDFALLFGAARLWEAVVKPFVVAAAWVAAGCLSVIIWPNSGSLMRIYVGVPLLLMTCGWGAVTIRRYRADAWSLMWR